MQESVELRQVPSFEIFSFDRDTSTQLPIGGWVISTGQMGQ
jgi:hypothetical protein